MGKDYEVSKDKLTEPSAYPSMQKYFSLENIRRVWAELESEFNLRESPIMLPDRKIWEYLSKVLHHEETINVKWPEFVTPLELPEHVDWLPDKVQKNIRLFVHYVEEYRNLPIITDKYESNGDREQSKDYLNILFGGFFRAFVDSSKLRNANIFGLTMNFEGLEYKLSHLENPNQNTEELLRLIRELHAAFSLDGRSTDTYLTWPKEDKLRFVEEIDSALDEFLQGVSTLYSVQ